MAKTNFNQTPYYDDFQEEKDFYRILFRPANAVQARELNQLQTILQNQIGRFGQHIFQPETRVLGGEVDFDNRVKWILSDVSSNENLANEDWRKANLHGQTIAQSGANPVKAHVLTTDAPNGLNQVKIYIKYLNKGGAGTTDTFSAEDEISISGTAETFDLISGTATGEASIATIKSGFYFVRNFFVRVDDQILILDPSGTSPTVRVGLSIEESIVTPEDDSSLLSNAQGTRNENGPGAHRFRITLELSKKDPSTLGTEDDEDFIELLKIENGQIVAKKDHTEYAKIGDELARRTHDESGDYTVNPFIAEVLSHDTDDTKLILSLDPGKAYVRGYEIETIGYTDIEIDKARDTGRENNRVIRTPLGNYILIENLYKLPVISDYDSVSLRDAQTGTPGSAAGNEIGTAKVRAIQFEGSGKYRLYLFDIQTESGSSFEQVKQVYSSSNSFTADVVLSQDIMEGTITSLNADNTVTGTGTWFVSKDSQALRVGDVLKVSETGTLITVSSVTNDVAFEAEQDETFENSTFARVYAELFETSNNILVYNLPNSFIKTIRDASSQVDTAYNVYRRFSGNTVASNSITLTVGAGETFASFSNSDYIVAVTTPGGGSGNSAGDILSISDSQVTFPNSTTCQISGLTDGDTLEVIATVRKTGGAASQEKTKTLQTSGSDSSGVGVTDLREFPLSKGDIYRLKKVYMSSDFTTAATSNDTDITDRFDLDNGQRDNFYGLGRILLKPGETAPTGRILVTYDYFSHSVNGNYFSVNSYSIEYEDIPSYVSSAGEIYDLRDCLDFRPLVNSTGNAFDNTTGSLTEIPKGDVQADYEYYLNRIDLLYLDYKGEFHVIKGTSALDPDVPQEPDDGMVLYQVNVRAYTLNEKEVFLDFRENRRYTMRDIGKLEKRISNLEYYTSLSLLEKETQDLEILDSNGFNKFKNGFIVDPFRGHGIGDVQNPDYRCSVDMSRGELRPLFYQDAVALEETNSTDEERSVSGYQRTGDLVTLPYTEKAMVEQLIASSFINVNPYAVFNFLGSIDLTPEDDFWKDTETLPHLIINQEGNYDSMVAVADAYGTVWNEWTENWTGSTVTKERDQKIVKRGNNEPDLVHSKKWPVKIQTTTRTTTTKTGTSTRTGERLTVVPDIVTTDLGEKVVSVAYVPFMRSRDVQFLAKGFKPNTRLYAFFDGVDVGAHVSAWSDPDVPEAFDGGDVISTGTALITDARGKAGGTFRIPNSDALRFKTGQRVFRLSDRSTNDANWTTSGENYYRAQGLLETKQRTIISTRNAKLVPEVVVESKIITQSTTETKSKTKWVDPLAQSFLVTKSGGAFLTSVDLWFSHKDANIPVIVQIREMINGSPGQKVLPFGEVHLDAENVNTNLVSNGVLSINGVVSNKAPVAANFLKTTVTFDAPVYVEEGVEYCLVLLSNSNNYQVWKATLGEEQIGTEFPVAEQPYAGSLFKSQNASTWTAEQESDLMFRLNHAEFDTSGTGILDLVNVEIPSRTLEQDPFQTVSGETTVRVFHRNHGISSGGSVTISGVSGEQNGIPDTELNGTHVVSVVDFDSYILSVTTPADTSGRVGGSGITATEDKQYSVLHPIISNIVLPETGIIYGIKTTSGKSVHGIESPYTLDSGFSNIIANKNIEFSSQRTIASAVNESANVGDKSLTIRATLSSANSNISPVIDLNRVAVVAVSNRIDSPTVSNTTVSDLDAIELVSSSDNVAFLANTITVDDANEASALSVVEVGQYLQISGADEDANNGSFLVLNVAYNETAGEIVFTVDASLATEAAGAGSVDIVHLRRFKSELAPNGGSAGSKYITRSMVLSQPANSLRVMFDAFRHTDSEFDVYYKILPVDVRGRFDDQPYVKMEPDSVVPISEHSDVFREYNYTVEGIGDFATVSVKLVMRSTNAAHPPRVRDFRVIALTT